jgi:G3E family GTPase
MCRRCGCRCWCRLLIEPSGLAHPAALLDMLRGEHLGTSLALLPVICLVRGAAAEVALALALAATGQRQQVP